MSINHATVSEARERLTRFDARKVYKDMVDSAHWDDVEEYAIWMEIGWGPFEFIPDNHGGSPLWVMHSLDGGWGHSWRGEYQTPFNGTLKSIEQYYTYKRRGYDGE